MMLWLSQPAREFAPKGRCFPKTNLFWEILLPSPEVCGGRYALQAERSVIVRRNTGGVRAAGSISVSWLDTRQL
jgi:hypothetical protein